MDTTPSRGRWVWGRGIKISIALYTELLTSGRLNDYLAELNEEAETMLFHLVKELAEKDGVPKPSKPRTVWSGCRLWTISATEPPRSFTTTWFTTDTCPLENAAVNRWRLFIFGGRSRRHKVGSIVEGGIFSEKIVACGRFLHNLGV